MRDRDPGLVPCVVPTQASHCPGKLVLISGSGSGFGGEERGRGRGRENFAGPEPLITADDHGSRQSVHREHQRELREGGCGVPVWEVWRCEVGVDCKEVRHPCWRIRHVSSNNARDEPLLPQAPRFRLCGV